VHVLIKGVLESASLGWAASFIMSMGDWAAKTGGGSSQTAHSFTKC
jgi:hypothetical protein